MTSLLGLLAFCSSSHGRAVPLPTSTAHLEQDPALAALMRGAIGSEEAIIARLASPGINPKRRKLLLGGLCQVRGMRGRYAAAAAACEAAARIDKSDRQSAIFWRSLAAVPPPRAIGSAELPVHMGKIGLSEVTASVNGIPVPFGIDTGAEVSIIPARLAAMLKVRPIRSEIQIDSSTAPVNGRLGVIDVLQLGDATIENVVVMILPDRQFDVAEDMRLPPLLGLPILQAFGRIAWLDNGKRLAFGDIAPAIASSAGAQLYWHTDGIGLDFRAAKGTFVTFFDTGANRLTLFSDAVPLLSDKERASIALRDSMTGGAGGIVKGREEHVAQVDATIAGVPVRFDNVPIERGSDKSGARLGMDYVGQLASLTLDFDTMRAFAIPKASAAASADLDFLAGDWLLTDSSGKQVGTSHIDVDLPGGVIHEVRRDESGVLPVWFARTERGGGGWSQFFPGPHGVLREFTPASLLGEWPMRLEGKALLGDGRNALFRLTLTRASSDDSNRLLQMSVDGGTNWQTIFDYRYHRVTH